MPFDISNILDSSGVGLEQTALTTFGASVDQFQQGSLGTVLPSAAGISPSVFQPTTSATPQENNTWYATSYAAALAGRTNYRPKLKFLFKVQFIFNQAVQNDTRFSSVFGGRTANDFTFMVTKVDRPKIDFEYEEDVNMYNFRTKVLKKITHKDLSISFYDDVGNRVFDFFRTLMMVFSPITRNQVTRDGTLNPPTPNWLTQANGMVFSDTTNANGDSAYRGVTNTQFGYAIDAIRVQQVFIDPTSGLSDAAQMVSYDFINPRIVSFDLDELDQDATNSLNVLSMSFNYDWLEMVKVGSLNNAEVNAQYIAQSYTNGAGNITGAPVDMTPAPMGIGPTGAGGGLYQSSLSTAGSQASLMQNLTTNMFAQSVSLTPGGGQFTAPIGGLVDGASRTQLSGILSSPSTASSLLQRGSAPSIVDSTLLPDFAAPSIDPSSDGYGDLGQIPNVFGGF